MPLASTDPTLERARLAAACLDGLFSVTELADRCGVSRPTVYKRVERYRDGGVKALVDRPSIAQTAARGMCGAEDAGPHEGGRRLPYRYAFPALIRCATTTGGAAGPPPG